MFGSFVLRVWGTAKNTGNVTDFTRYFLSESRWDEDRKDSQVVNWWQQNWDDERGDRRIWHGVNWWVNCESANVFDIRWIIPLQKPSQRKQGCCDLRSCCEGNNLLIGNLKWFVIVCVTDYLGERCFSTWSCETLPWGISAFQGAATGRKVAPHPPTEMNELQHHVLETS